jgi:choline dehydrogenase-like flavoprotein
VKVAILEADARVDRSEATQRFWNSAIRVPECPYPPSPETEIQHRDTAEDAGHIMGTARMGNDPRGSVVDRDLRSRDHSNLFILGSTVFPTCATANPTLTIAALSLRAVDQVKANLTR